MPTDEATAAPLEGTAALEDDELRDLAIPAGHATGPPLVTLRGLSRVYRTAADEVAALDNVHLDIAAGEIILLVGPSGSGKTTLLNVVAALDAPTDGEYVFDGQAVPRKDVEAMTAFRRENIGYIFQFYNLLHELTVLENVLLVQELAGRRDEERARELLALVGLKGLGGRYPAELSGGQQQRVAIARSLAKRPRVLLGDEPTGNLDSETTKRVMKVLVKACRRERITAIIVTHDTSLTRFATRVLRLDSGRLKGDEPGGLVTAASRAVDISRDTASRAAEVSRDAAARVVETVERGRETLTRAAGKLADRARRWGERKRI